MWLSPRRFDGLGDTISGSAIAKVVEHDTCCAERHVPIVGLMQVIVQPDEGALLPVGPVALEHFATAAESTSVGRSR